MLQCEQDTVGLEDIELLILIQNIENGEED